MSPHVLAFTADIVEIRMVSNGSLIQTIAVPDLQLLSKKIHVKTLEFIEHILTLSLSLSLSLSLPLLFAHRAISTSLPLQT